VLSLAAVLAGIYGLKQIAQDGLELLPALAIVAGAALGALFVHRQRTLDDPMIDLHLFRIRAFSASLAAYALSIAVVFGAFVFILQHLQLVLGLSPLRAGLWMVPSGLAFIAGGVLTPALVRRVRPGFVMAGGLAVSVTGFVLLALVDASSGVALVVAALVIFSIGLTPMITLATDLIVGSAPKERAGAASAISETGAELGGALGIAILGTIGTAVYQADGRAAGETLGGAVEAAERLPVAARADLLEPAREAFTNGLQVAATVSGAIVVAAALLIATLLRRERSARPVVAARPVAADGCA
jgi:DHA2 family multidrug resistance protein-like MFS transporter